jgi:hypothetical protein
MPLLEEPLKENYLKDLKNSLANKPKSSEIMVSLVMTFLMNIGLDRTRPLKSPASCKLELRRVKNIEKD